jgi:hypothetical protein
MTASSTADYVQMADQGCVRNTCIHKVVIFLFNSLMAVCTALPWLTWDRSDTSCRFGLGSQHHRGLPLHGLF